MKHSNSQAAYHNTLSEIENLLGLSIDDMISASRKEVSGQSERRTQVYASVEKLAA